MSLFGRLQGGSAAGPRASYQDLGGGMEIDLGNPEHVEYLRAGHVTAAGIVVSEAGALRLAVAWRCLHVLSGAVGNMPVDLFDRVDERTRKPAVGHPMRDLISIRPNSWQTPQDFKRMLTAHVVLRGNGYGLKITSAGRTVQIWPMHPDRVRCDQLPDMTLRYTYTTKDGRKITLKQDEVLHIRGLTLDGVTGMGVLSHARETIGSSIQAQQSAARIWKQGIIAPGALKTQGTMSEEAYARLRDSLETRRAGAENAHKWLILEEGADVTQLTFSAADMQFLDSRKFDRTDVAMFFGVPESLLGSGEKDSNWGTGLEQRSQFFVTYVLEDYLKAWEEALERDTLTKAETRHLYYRFNRNALARGDLKTRWETYVKSMQWGVRSPNAILALEDENPREGGDIYYDPPNTAGDQQTQDNNDDRTPPDRRA